MESVTTETPTPKPPPGKLAEEKWGEALRNGFQLIPNLLIQSSHELGLDPLDVLILLNITAHWWQAAALPYPRPGMIADRIGVSRRTVERRLNDMEKSGVIKRLPTEQIRGASVRRINPAGLVAKLTNLARNAPVRRGAAGLDSKNEGDEAIDYGL